MPSEARIKSAMKGYPWRKCSGGICACMGCYGNSLGQLAVKLKIKLEDIAEFTDTVDRLLAQ